MPDLLIKENKDNMWIFTQTGFVSAVRHYSEPDIIVVRARDSESLETLVVASGEPIQMSPVNDYPYRVHVTEKIFSSWLLANVTSLDYTNFKDRVHDTRGDNFASALMGVWEIMHEVEDDDARSR
jgi:hypothetical protein